VAAELDKYEILLGITGGIAAYKSAMLCSQLVQHGAKVSVVMTEHAQRFITPLTFSTLSGQKVYTDLWTDPQAYEVQHISLTTQADLIVVAPATLNIIGKMAAGICDDLLSTVLASAESDILLAPAMNHRMWNNPITQRNIETLRKSGCHFIGPETGRLACGEEAIGRMSEPQDIFARIVELLKK